MGNNDFEANVFINCPFDKEYNDLLKPLLFTVIRIGLEPRIASERLDSGEVRLEKIVELIECSKYGIHDLSRCRAEKRGDSVGVTYSALQFLCLMALELP